MFTSCGHVEQKISERRMVFVRGMPIAQPPLAPRPRPKTWHMREVRRWGTDVHDKNGAYSAGNHVAMLDDDVRRSAFAAAIGRAAKGRRVLDVGSGPFLLLARLCERAGACFVACVRAARPWKVVRCRPRRVARCTLLTQHDCTTRLPTQTLCHCREGPDAEHVARSYARRDYDVKLACVGQGDANPAVLTELCRADDLHQLRRCCRRVRRLRRRLCSRSQRIRRSSRLCCWRCCRRRCRGCSSCWLGWRVARAYEHLDEVRAELSAADVDLADLGRGVEDEGVEGGRHLPGPELTERPAAARGGARRVLSCSVAKADLAAVDFLQELEGVPTVLHEDLRGTHAHRGLTICLEAGASEGGGLHARRKQSARAVCRRRPSSESRRRPSTRAPAVFSHDDARSQGGGARR